MKIRTHRMKRPISPSTAPDRADASPMDSPWSASQHVAWRPMVSNSAIFQGLVMFVLCCTLSACGIDRGGIVDVHSQASSTLFTPAQKSMANVLVGEITAITGNQITLSDVTMDLGSTQITLNGEPVSITDLHTGMYAVATTSASTGVSTPQTLAIDHNVAGADIQVPAGTTMVEGFGQTILLDQLNAANIVGGALPVNAPQRLAISGPVNATNDIIATAVAPYDAGAPEVVTGYVTTVDTANFSLMIGGQSFDYSQAQMINTRSGMVEANARLRLTIDPVPVNGLLRVLTIDDASYIDPALPAGASVYISGTFSQNPGVSVATAGGLAGVSVDSGTVIVGTPPATPDSNLIVEVLVVIQNDGSLRAQAISYPN